MNKSELCAAFEKGTGRPLRQSTVDATVQVLCKEIDETGHGSLIVGSGQHRRLIKVARDESVEQELLQIPGSQDSVAHSDSARSKWILHQAVAISAQ